jgi:hypothetical protein
VERISDFVEWYTMKNAGPNDNNSIIKTGRKAAVSERKTVLDLCAHMFHPKDTSQDMSGTMEYNEIK